MPMPRISIVFGTLLLVLGAGTYLAALAGSTGTTASPTALIPAFFGIVLIVCGVVVSAKPSLRNHVMHVAALVGLLGVVGGLMRPAKALLGGTLVVSLPVIAQITMALLCGVFVVLCVRSFIEARRNRTAV
jgi:uncharacterized membrane protein